jgi:serine/threonine protein phosphatase 1
MFGFLFGKTKTKEPKTKQPLNIWGGASVNPSSPLIIVGDVHGCKYALDELLGKLDLDAHTVVFVGDIVDRGEDSAAVISDVYARSQAQENPAICLMGNHERMMLDFLDDPVKTGARWLRFGGLQTLLSFNVTGVTERSTGADLTTARDALRAALPEGVEVWLRELPFQFHSGNVHIVHAAASPNHPMNEQEEQVLLWGHPQFLKNPRSDDEWVVHGHTIVAEPTMLDGRISIDTGAYATGVLTAAVVDNTGVVFVQS